MAVTNVPRIFYLPVASFGQQPTSRVRSKRRLRGKENKLHVAEIVELTSMREAGHEKIKRVKNQAERNGNGHDPRDDLNGARDSVLAVKHSRRRKWGGTRISHEDVSFTSDEATGEQTVAAINLEQISPDAIEMLKVRLFKRPETPREQAIRHLTA